MPSVSCRHGCWSKPVSADSHRAAKLAPVPPSCCPGGAPGAKGSRSEWAAREGTQQQHWFAAAAAVPHAAPVPIPLLTAPPRAAGGHADEEERTDGPSGLPRTWGCSENALNSYQGLRSLRAGLHLLQRGIGTLPPSPITIMLGNLCAGLLLFTAEGCPYGSLVL